jgi:hypothetical protein
MMATSSHNDHASITTTATSLGAVTMVSLLLAPLWFLLGNAISGYRMDVPSFVAYLVGSVLVGWIYAFATERRKAPPGLSFSFLVPAIGVVCVAIHEVLEIGEPRYLPEALAMGVILTYFFFCYATIPLALLHTYLMRSATLKLGKRT